VFFLAPLQLFDQTYDCDYHPTTGSITHVRSVGNELADQDYGKDFPSSGERGVSSLLCTPPNSWPRDIR